MVDWGLGNREGHMERARAGGGAGRVSPFSESPVDFDGSRRGLEVVLRVSAKKGENGKTLRGAPGAIDNPGLSLLQSVVEHGFPF